MQQEIDEEPLDEAEIALLKAQEEMEREIEEASLNPTEDHPETQSHDNGKHEQISTKHVSPKVNKDLIFVRLIDPIHIPSYLVEKIKSRNFPVEKFYSYMKIVCTFNSPDGPILNNCNFLYAIVHERLKQVKGFLWMTLDILSGDLYINQFSIDDEYWNKGKSIDLVLDNCKQMMKELKISRIVWVTKNVKLTTSFGFKRSQESIMVYEG